MVTGLVVCAIWRKTAYFGRRRDSDNLIVTTTTQFYSAQALKLRLLYVEYSGLAIFRPCYSIVFPKLQGYNIMIVFIELLNTVKPLLTGHPWGKGKWPLKRG